MVPFSLAQHPIHGLLPLHALQWLTEHVGLDYQQRHRLLWQQGVEHLHGSLRGT